MAFLPERNFLEETIANTYDLSNGATGFTTSDISEFNTLSLQFVYNGISDSNIFILEQSNDNVNWSEISETYELPVGNGNFIIDKSTLTTKYVKVNFLTTGSGTITIKSIVKR